MKAFLAALAVGAFALIAGASAATSAPSREHLLVGYNHAPTAADRAAIASVGGKIRREFGAISALAVDLPSGKASEHSQPVRRQLRRDGRSSYTAVAVGDAADLAARTEHQQRAVRPRDDAHRRGAGRGQHRQGASHPDASLEEAQENKYRLVFEKLRLKPGDRLLDVGCGWGGMVRYAARHGVKAVGVTLSKEQATWAQKAIAEQGLTDLAEVRHGDYRDVAETGFDAVSSIGLTEHIGVHNYPSYFRFLQSKMRPGALLLNHCITRPDNTGGAVGPVVSSTATCSPTGSSPGPAGSSPRRRTSGSRCVHEENLRHHYALTLRDWCRNLVEHWDEAVEEVGLPDRQGVGPVHGRVAGGLRDQRRFSCTRCSRSSSTIATATAACRCGRGGRP